MADEPATPAAPPRVLSEAEWKALKARRDAAGKERLAFQPLLDEAFKYAIPFRKSRKANGPGEKRVDQVFDHTAIDSAFRFAGKLQQDVWPAGGENFGLEPGPLVRAREDREALQAQLAPMTAIVQAFFDDGTFDMAFHEVALDLAAGSGNLLMLPARPDQPEKLWNPISVSIDETAWELGPDNDIVGVYWERRMTVRQLFAAYPDGTFSKRLRDKLVEKPEAELCVNVDTIWEPARRRWVVYVTCHKDDGLIFSSESRTCPWATPRYFRVPGETYGRGPVMLAMPSIKTLNTAKRIQLQAAAIAMLGIYTAVDDGVFNPDNSALEPGTFWKVARNGGPMGPSVERFPDPRLDLSGLVVENMQMDVKATMMDQALPVEGAAVKSATEILERVRRLAQDHIGAYGRLVKELVVPVVRRVLELAYERQLLAQPVDIDQLLIKVRVKSPLAIAREQARIDRILQWLQIVLAIAAAAGDPRMARYVARLEEALRDVGQQWGIDPALIVGTEEARQLREADEKRDLALAAAAALGQAAPALAGGAQ